MPDVEFRNHRSRSPIGRLDLGRLRGQQEARARATHEVLDLARPGPRPDADRDHAGLLARQHRCVEAGTVGQV